MLSLGKRVYKLTTSSRTAFLDAVGATTFIVSAGPTRYGSVVLPDQEVIESRGQLDFRYVFGADGFRHCNPLLRTETDKTS